MDVRKSGIFVKTMSSKPPLSLNSEPLSDLLEYDVPDEIISEIRRSGINQLHQMQKDTLKKGLLHGTSILLVSPSGSGKTLVGELAVTNNIYESSQKALYLVPLRALANEKYNEFTQKYQNLNINSLIVIGDQEVSNNELVNADLLIMTYEKFDAFLRKKPISDWIRSISTIVIDEVHILGDTYRGPRLESLIIRMYHLHPKIQFIFLSATIGNPNYIFRWLNYLEQKYHKQQLQMIINKIRPIELKYKIYITKKKIDVIEKIVEKTLQEHGQVLIFVNSRAKTETFAKKLAFRSSASTNKAKKAWIKSLLDELTIKGSFNKLSIDSDLFDVISRGIGFHHAGLSYLERKLIETAFLNQTIKVIFTTTSLSAGINLPARAVIIHESFLYHKNDQSQNLPIAYSKYIKKPMDQNLFHQICGRAGRPGYDIEGNVYILAKSQQEKEQILNFYFSDRDPNKNLPKYAKIKSKIPINKELLLETVLLNIQKATQFQILKLLEFLQDSLIASDLVQFKIPINNYLNLFYSDLISLYKTFSSPIDRIICQNAEIKVEIMDITPNSVLSGVIFIRLQKNTVKDINIPPNFWEILSKHIQNSRKSAENELMAQWENAFTFSTHLKNRCSCGNQILREQIPLLMFPPKDFHVQFLCLDQVCVLYALLQSQSLANFTKQNIDLMLSSNLTPMNESLINDLDIFFHKSIYPKTILEKLENYHLVSSVNSDLNDISCTIAGEIALNCYINPSVASNFYVLSEKFQKISPNFSICLILEQILEVLTFTNENLPEQPLAILLDWIEEASLEVLIEKYNAPGSPSHLTSMDLEKFFDRFGHNLKFFKEYYKRISYSTLYTFFNDLYLRVKWGIKEDLLPWANHFNNIDCRLFRLLIKQNHLTPQNFVLMSVQKLSDLMNVTQEEILFIKQNYHP